MSKSLQSELRFSRRRRIALRALGLACFLLFPVVLFAQEVPLFPKTESHGLLRQNDITGIPEFLSFAEFQDSDHAHDSAETVHPTNSPPYPIRIVYYNWYDSQRRRSVPAKVYMPNRLSLQSPIIIFSHGLGGSRERCAYLGEYWASNGYVSVHLQHFGSDETVWKGKLRPLHELKVAYENNWTGRTRVRDIQFAIAQLQKIAESKDDYLSSILDVERIGLAGYDMGAFASLLMVGQLSPEGYTSTAIPEIKAVLAMSPPVQSNRAPIGAVYSQIETPCLFITGTNDNGTIGSTKAQQRRIPFDMIDCNDQYLLTLRGSDHQVYAGHVFTGQKKSDAPYRRTISRVSTNFWNAYLAENPKALQFMMGPDLRTLTSNTGGIERKFYIRETPPNTSPQTFYVQTPVLPPKGPIESAVRHETFKPEQKVQSSRPNNSTERRVERAVPHETIPAAPRTRKIPYNTNSLINPPKPLL